MPVKKKPSAAQLAARAKFVKMVRARAAAKKKAMPKKAAAKKVAGLDKVVRKGKKTSVYYSRVSGIKNQIRRYEVSIDTTNDGFVYGFANTLVEAKKIFKLACNVKALDILRTKVDFVRVSIYDTEKNKAIIEKVIIK